MSKKRWLMWLVPGVASWRLINVWVRRRKRARDLENWLNQPAAITKTPPLWSRKRGECNDGLNYWRPLRTKDPLESDDDE